MISLGFLIVSILILIQNSFSMRHVKNIILLNADLTELFMNLYVIDKHFQDCAQGTLHVPQQNCSVHPLQDLQPITSHH